MNRLRLSAGKMNQPLLNEGGLKIDLTHLASEEKSLKWRDLGIVRIERKGSLLERAFNPTFVLMVSTKTNQMASPFFETKDPELAKKIEAAIQTVAQQLGVKRHL